MFELAAQLQGLSGDTTQNQLVCKLKQSKKNEIQISYLHQHQRLIN